MRGSAALYAGADPQGVAVAGGMADVVRADRRSATVSQRRRSVSASGSDDETDLPVPGLIRGAVCKRKMEGSPRAHGTYYRCPARTLAPGSPVLATHPPAAYLGERRIRFRMR